MVLTPEEMKKIYYEEDEKETKPMGFFEKIRLVLIHPHQFFYRIKNEKDLQSPFAYYLIIYAIVFSVIYLVFYLFSSTVFLDISATSLASIPYSIIGGVANVLVSAFFVHIFVRLFKGQGNYSDSFRAIAYGQTPILLGVVIVISLIFIMMTAIGILIAGLLLIVVSLWSIWLQYKILAAVHKISDWRAFFALILPVIIIFSIIMIFVLPYLMGVFSIGGENGGSTVPCSPCFSYFAFIDYADGTLKIRNGPYDIQSMSVTTGTLSTTAPGLGDDIIITGLSRTGDVTITITYTITASGLPYTDYAIIHNMA